MTNKQASKINEYKTYFRQIPATRWAQVLQNTKEEIALLESIYQTGGEHNHYSRTFEDAAVRERQELCLKSSALHALLREREATQ